MFAVQSIFIALHDPATNLISFPYDLDEGAPFDRGLMTLGPGLTSTVITTGRSLRIGTIEDQEAAGAIQVGGPDTSSWLGAPITGATRVIGVLGLESVEADAFTEADERVHRHPRLEHGRRPRERAPVRRDEAAADRDGRARRRARDHQRASSRASPPSSRCRRCTTSSATGSREIFDAQVVDIGIYDRETGLIHFPYTIERGVRFPDEPIALMGIRKHVIETREPLLINDVPPSAAIEIGQAGRDPGRGGRSRRPARPLIVGGEATGLISLQNLDRSTRSATPTFALLTTLASSLSVALENARLVDETRQRADRAGDRQRDRPGGWPPARPRPADRAGRRPACGTPSTPTSSTSRCIDRETDLIEFPYYSENGKYARAGAGDPVRRGPDVADPADPRAAAASTATRTSRRSAAAGVGTPVEVVPRRPDPRRRRGDRRGQRPEHRGRGPLRRGRRARCSRRSRRTSASAIQNARLYREAQRRPTRWPRSPRWPGDLGDARPDRGPRADRRADADPARRRHERRLPGRAGRPVIPRRSSRGARSRTRSWPTSSRSARASSAASAASRSPRSSTTSGRDPRAVVIPGTEDGRRGAADGRAAHRARHASSA